MIIAAGALMLASGSLHAVVNAVVKGNRHKFATRAVIDGTAALIALPFAFLVEIPTGAWSYLLASTLLHACYLFCAIKTFEAGDLSAAYPLQRGIAPLFTTAGALLLLQEAVSSSAAIGILVLGCSILAMALGRVLGRWGLLWACLTGVFIAACTIVDAEGVRAAPSSMSYITWLFLFVGPTMVAFIYCLTGPRLWEFARVEWIHSISAGVLSVFGYGIALTALRLGPTAPLAALRETSVVAAYLIGVFFFREVHSVRRLLSVAGVAAGAALILRG